MKISLFFIPCLMFMVVNTYGQTSTVQDYSTLDKFFMNPDLAIDRLTEAALLNSALVDAIQLDRSIIKEDLHIARKDIYNNVSLVGDYLYGNLGLLSLSEGAQIGIGTGLASRYSGGVRFSLPIDRLTSRHNRINRVELQLKQAEFLQIAKEDEIKQIIIGLYQDVVLSRRMLKVHTEAKESASINRQMGEKSFREGQILLADLSVINESYTRAAIDYEASYTSYETAIRVLEEVAGVKILNLMAN